VLHNEYDSEGQLGLLVTSPRPYMIPKLKRLYCPRVEVPIRRPWVYKGTLDSAKRRVVTLPRNVRDNMRALDSGPWRARQSAVRVTMWVNAAIGRTALLVEVLRCEHMTLWKTPSLMESLEDKLCEHVPSDKLTKIGSGNNHWQ